MTAKRLGKRFEAGQGDLCTFRGYERVCYLVGAGFSAATRYEYPTAVGFFDPEYKFEYPAEDLEGDVAVQGAIEPAPGGEGLLVRGPYDNFRSIKGLFNFLEEWYGPPKLLNLESVLTDLYVRGFGLGRSWEGAEPGDQGRHRHSVRDLQKAYSQALSYIEFRLGMKSLDQEPCCLSSGFVNLLKGQDSIVTLNYDTVVERHLALVRKGTADARLQRLGSVLGPPATGWHGTSPRMFVDPGTEERAFFVKLHGSIDWFSCSNEDCPYGAYIETFSSWYGHKNKQLARRCAMCGCEAQSVIVPPIVSKGIERFPKLSLMWLHANEALFRSQRWVFMGVSLAPTDFPLSALLRAVSSDLFPLPQTPLDRWQICIVNKSSKAAEEVGERLVNSLSPKAVKLIEVDPRRLLYFGSIDEYLKVANEVDLDRKNQE